MFLVKKKSEVARFGLFLILVGLLAYFVLNRAQLFRSSQQAPRSKTPVPVTGGLLSPKVAEAPAPPVVNGHDFFAEARLTRDQERSLWEEKLNGVINNPNMDADVRKSAAEELEQALRYASLENRAEALIRGKGVQDVIVTLSENSAMVYVKATNHNQNQAMQVADLVATVTGLKAAAVKVGFRD